MASADEKFRQRMLKAGKRTKERAAGLTLSTLRRPELTQEEQERRLREFLTSSGKAALRGPFEIIGGPVDLLGMGLEAAGLRDDPNLPLGTKFFEKQLGIPERQKGVIPNVIGGATGGGPFGLIGKTAGAVPRAINIIRNTIIGGGAGGGGELGATIDPNGTALPIAGALVGGLTASGLANIAKTGGKAIAPLLGGDKKAAVRERVETFLGDQLEPDALRRAQRAELLNQKTGANIGLADISPGVRATVTDARKQSARFDAQVRAQRTKNIATLAEKAEGAGPQGKEGIAEAQQGAKDIIADRTEKARTLTREVSARLEAQAQQFIEAKEKVLGAFTKQMDAVAREVGDIPERSVIGLEAKKTIGDVAEIERARVSAPYQEFDNSVSGSIGTKFDDGTQSVKATVAEMKAGAKVAQKKITKKTTKDEAGNVDIEFLAGDLLESDFPVQQMNVIEALPATTTLGEVRAVRTSILEAIGKERIANQGGSSTLSHNLGKLLGVVQKTIDTFAENSPALKEINTNYKNYIATFEKGAIGDIVHAGRARKTESGEGIFKILFSGGAKQVENAQALVKAIGQDAASKLTRHLALSELVKFSRDADGVFIPGKVKGFLKTHERVLEVFPVVKEEIQQLRGAAKRIEDLKPPSILGQEKDILQGLKSSTRIIPEGLDDSAGAALLGDSPRNVVERLMKTANPNESLARMLGVLDSQDPKGARGLLKETYRWFMNKAQIQTKTATTLPSVRSDAMGQMLADPEFKPVLIKHFGRDTWKFLKAVHASFKEVLASPEFVTQTKGFREDQKLAEITGIILARAFARARGIVGTPFLTADVAARRIAKNLDDFDARELQALTEELFFDKNLAKTVERLQNVSTSREAKRTLKVWAQRNILPAVPAASSAGTQQRERPLIPLISQPQLAQ